MINEKLLSELHNLIQQELESGEYIIWVDQPIYENYERPVRVWLWRSVLATPLYLLMFPAVLNEIVDPGFANFFVTTIGILVAASIGFSLFSTGILLYISIYKEYRKQQTIYALTNQRAIILKELRLPIIESYPLKKLQISLEMSKTKKDAGSLYFGFGIGFREIRNVEKVKNHIELLKEHPFANYEPIAIT